MTELVGSPSHANRFPAPGFYAHTCSVIRFADAPLGELHNSSIPRNRSTSCLSPAMPFRNMERL